MLNDFESRDDIKKIPLGIQKSDGIIAIRFLDPPAFDCRYLLGIKINSPGLVAPLPRAIQEPSSTTSDIEEA